MSRCLRAFLLSGADTVQSDPCVDLQCVTGCTSTTAEGGALTHQPALQLPWRLQGRFFFFFFYARIQLLQPDARFHARILLSCEGTPNFLSPEGILKVNNTEVTQVQVIPLPLRAASPTLSTQTTDFKKCTISEVDQKFEHMIGRWSLWGKNVAI